MSIKSTTALAWHGNTSYADGAPVVRVLVRSRFPRLALEGVKSRMSILNLGPWKSYEGMRNSGDERRLLMSFVCLRCSSFRPLLLHLQESADPNKTCVSSHEFRALRSLTQSSNSFRSLASSIRVSFCSSYDAREIVGPRGNQWTSYQYVQSSSESIYGGISRILVEENRVVVLIHPGQREGLESWKDYV